MDELSWLTQIPFYLFFYYFFKINLFILFIFGCVGSSLLCVAFSSCGKQGLFFGVVRGLLVAVASIVGEHRL